MSYFELLKDPRWQKKRLEILDRDDWACRICFDTKNTLHIHHLNYHKHPWDADNKDLITLCSDCHKYETENLKPAISKLNISIRRNFPSYHILKLSQLLNYTDAFSYDPFMVILEEFLIDKELQNSLFQRNLKKGEQKSG